MGKTYTLLLLTLGILVLAYTRGPVTQPKVTAWAWKRPEYFSWAGDGEIDIAVLLATFSVRGENLNIEYRREPLTAPKTMVKTAVFRISDSPDIGRVRTPTALLVNSVMRITEEAKLLTIQIDFDARLSQREWYVYFLKMLRSRMKSNMRLEMTALASWCREVTPWFSDLPVDAVVPMFFRMGKDSAALKEMLKSPDRFLSSQCLTAVGVSVDEPVIVPAAVKRLFVFNPQGWQSTDKKKVDALKDR